VSHPRFFLSSLDADSLTLEGTEARHAARSRRLAVGDTLTLFDGSGREADGVITAVAAERVEVRVTQRRAATLAGGPRLTLAAAIPKGPRAEWMIEKLAELGLHEFWPLQTRRSVVDPRPTKIEKWRRIVRESAKQSGRNDLMTIAESIPFEQAAHRAAGFGCVWIADRGGEAWRAASNRTSHDAGQRGKVGAVDRGDAPHLALIGPEGGWTEEEHALLAARGARRVVLSANTLRIEAAAVAFTAIWHAG